MDNFTFLLIGIGLLILSLFLFKKYIALPQLLQSNCDTKCVDGVCFPSCNPKLNINNYDANDSNDTNDENNANYENDTIDTNNQNDNNQSRNLDATKINEDKKMQ